MVGKLPLAVLDLGAGTGKLTRPSSRSAIASSRSSCSRRCAPASRPLCRRCTRFMGSAEAIPLYDGAADVVTSAQAFHRFDHDDALPEIARVLRPGGHLALVWNSRDDRDPWDGSPLGDHRERDDRGVGRRAGARRERSLWPRRDGRVLLRADATATASSISSSHGATSPSCRRSSASRCSTRWGRSTTRRPAPEGVRLAYGMECFRARRA